jgi:hypothetical protein
VKSTEGCGWSGAIRPELPATLIHDWTDEPACDHVNVAIASLGRSYEKVCPFHETVKFGAFTPAPDVVARGRLSNTNNPTIAVLRAASR